MEQDPAPSQEKDGDQGAKEDVVGGASGPLAGVDPFADLLELSFPKPASNTAGARAKPAASASPVHAPSAWGEVAPVMTGSLAVKKRKSQESRHKRDDFLNQMTSFLEGIESKTTADVIPPEPPVSLATAESYTYTSTAFPPTATESESVSGKQVLWANAVQDRRASSGAASASSLLMQEDLFEDPFVRKELPSQTAKPHAGLRAAMIGAENTVSHPRGSLFDDDDVGLEDTGPGEEEDEGQSGRQGNVLTSDPVDSPRQRVPSSPLPFSAPPHDTRASLTQGRSRSKSKPSRGLDLEEVRRRTSLLSGGSRAPPQSVAAPARPAAASPRPPAASSYFDGGWGPQQPAAPSGEVPPHPLHAAPADPLFSGGNYFNEDLLRARGERNSRTALGEGHTGGREVGRGGWASGDALKDSAGSFLNTARDGAKTLLQDAKAGVDAVGASWQSSRDENGQQRVAGRPSRGSRQEQAEGEREFEVTFGEGRFGFTLFREDAGPRKGQGVVCKVHTGSTAHSLGVSEGDTVTGVNKQRYETYDDVMAVLPKLPRPVLITFSRGGTGGSTEGRSMAARRASTTSEDVQGGGNPLEWLAKLNPFDKGRRDEEDELRASGKSQVDSKVLASREHGSTGEVFARGVRGGVFSWSYYGTSDGIESNTRDAYTEHVMRCQWGKTVHTMHDMSWMVARRYREFDALDLDLRDAYPDRKDALPRLPPKEFFKMAPDVVERRAKGLELYMTTLIRRFPDMLASSHLDRFLTISERLSTLQTPAAVRSSSPRLSYKNLGANGSSSNVFPAHSPESRSSSLVGTDYILNLMSSEEAWRLSQARRSSPVDVAFAEDLVHELEDHISRIPPDAHLLSDEKLYGLVARCQKTWPGLKSAAAAASGASSPTLLPRIVQCDEGMECAFENLRTLLTSRGYIG